MLLFQKLGDGLVKGREFLLPSGMLFQWVSSTVVPEARALLEWQLLYLSRMELWMWVRQTVKYSDMCVPMSDGHADLTSRD